MRAFILAGGSGTRLGEETDVCPKPMCTSSAKKDAEQVVMQSEKNYTTKHVNYFSNPSSDIRILNPRYTGQERYQ
jgi:choline kinase